MRAISLMAKLRRVCRGKGMPAQVKKHSFCHAEIHGAQKTMGEHEEFTIMQLKCMHLTEELLRVK